MVDRFFSRWLRLWIYALVVVPLLYVGYVAFYLVVWGGTLLLFGVGLIMTQNGTNAVPFIVGCLLAFLWAVFWITLMATGVISGLWTSVEAWAAGWSEV